MYLKSLAITILILYLLNGCGVNRLSYIENDNYNKSYHYYLQDFKLNSHRYKLKSIWDDKISYINTKKVITHMKKKYINKHNIYIVILSPQIESKILNIKPFFNFIEDFYDFLTNEKEFTNQIYILGIPSTYLDNYKAIVYFVPL